MYTSRCLHTTCHSSVGWLIVTQWRHLVTYIWVNFGSGNAGLILVLRPANEKRRYKVTPSLIGWAQT